MAVRISTNERLNLISNLSTMLAAGISLLDTIESLMEESKSGAKKILTTLHEDVSQGKKIAESLRKYPESFDIVTTNLIEASEEAGTLDTTLADLTKTIKREIEFSEKIKSALMYPALVMVVFVVILTIILTMVIPKIADVFLKLRVPLPLPTRVLIWLSNFVTQNTLALGVGIVVGIILFIVFYRTQKKRMLRALFRLPGLSTLALEIDITRFARSMALLLNSGLPILNAIELSQQVAVKKEMVDVIADSHKAVSAGKTFSDSFKKNKNMPRMVVRMLQAGEKTGTLAKSMQDLAEYFDGLVSSRIKALTTLLEPVLLIFIAVFIGGMMLSIIAPIYSLIGQINVR